MIIDLEERRKWFVAYERSVAEAEELIEEMTDDLFTAAVNIAMNGPWREWNESVPEGTEVELNSEMLKDSGDDRVVAIIDLMYQAERISFRFPKAEEADSSTP